MATLVIRFPDGNQQEQPLAGELIVGRADGNDLVLAEGGVSRRHARFFFEGATVMVEDLGSANGTFVDGERIEAPTPLGPRAQVVIGDYEIALKAGARRPSGARPGPGRRPSGPRPGPANGNAGTTQMPSVKPPRATRQLPSQARANPEGGAARRPPPPRVSGQAATGPSLRGLTGPWANKLYPLRGTSTVGRVAGVQIQLEDESVSRRHAEVERAGDVVVVRDLGSANGTLVNGQPLEGEVELAPGDVVQFGMIELSYEVGDEAALAAPTRRGGAGAARGSGARRGVAAEADPAAKKKKVMLFAGGGVGVFLVLGLAVKLLGGGGPPQEVVQNTPQPLDPSAKVEELLSECRSHASTELGVQPKWELARKACEAARRLDPINEDVLALIQKIELEQTCEKHYEQGKRLVSLLRDDEALTEFGKIKKECSYYQIVRPRAQETIAAVMKKAAEDCKTYASRGLWEQAEPRCERYMTFACQGMTEEELHPPVGYTVDLWGRRCRRDCWRPKEKMYLYLLRAREKRDKNAGPWMCPPTELFRTEEQVTSPKKVAAAFFKDKYEEPLIREALLLYWEGKSGEASVKLHRLREQSRKAQFHQLADDLRVDIEAVTNLYRTGAGALGQGEVEEASESFKEVIRLDQKLTQGLDKPSFYKTSVQQEMAQVAYERGRHWAERKDYVRACRIWKIGFSYFKGDLDLLKAMGFCSNKGNIALQGARGCEDLKTVMDYAVEGDGLDKKVLGLKQEWKCAG